MPDEPSSLLVTKAGGSVRLDWAPPATAPDSYDVRRCLLASLRVLPSTYYGNCVAQGLTATTHAEPVPAGDVFYLVSAEYGGTEGSLGRWFNGHIWRERVGRDCSMPEMPAVMTLRIDLASAVDFCGVQLLVRYPPELVEYVTGSSACTDLTSGWLAATNDGILGQVNQACVGSVAASGPGRIVQMDFRRGDCPIGLDVFDLVTCTATDCMASTLTVECEFR